MTKFSAVIIAAFSLILASTIPAVSMESASYRLQPVVLSGGGGTISSASFRLDGTVGQSTPVGIANSAVYQMLSGFWHQLLKLIANGDVNGDGVIDLEDAVIALQILSNFYPSEVYAGADVDGDGVIGIQETLFILQKVGLVR